MELCFRSAKINSTQTWQSIQNFNSILFSLSRLFVISCVILDAHDKVWNVCAINIHEKKNEKKTRPKNKHKTKFDTNENVSVNSCTSFARHHFDFKRILNRKLTDKWIKKLLEKSCLSLSIPCCHHIWKNYSHRSFICRFHLIDKLFVRFNLRC